MSDVENNKDNNKDNEAAIDNENYADNLIIEYIDKFIPTDESVTISGELVLSKLYDMAGDKYEALLDNDFYKFLSSQEAQEKPFTPNEIKAEAVKHGVKGAEKYSPEKTNTNDVSQDAEQSTKRESPSNGPSSGSENAKSKIDPEKFDRVKKAIEKSTGKELSDEEVMKMMKNLQAQNQAQGMNPNHPMGGMGNMGGRRSLMSGVIDRLSDSMERRRQRNHQKEEVVQFNQEVTRPGADVTAKEAKVHLEKMSSSRKMIEDAFDSLISGKNEYGDKLSVAQKRELQKETLDQLDSYQNQIKESQDLAVDELLPKDQRVALHDEAMNMHELLNKAKALPEGRSKKGPDGNEIPSEDKKFKDTVNEKVDTLQEQVKSLMEAIKGFFKSFKKTKDNDNEMEMAP